MAETGAGRADRKQHGAWYTPPELVETIIEALVTEGFVASRRVTGRRLRVLDPACGDGRFLDAAERTVRRFGGDTELVGVELDPDAARRAAVAVPRARIITGDALDRRWSEGPFDLIVGNPPFLSQLARATTRGGAGARGGGPYADQAVQFLALGAELVEPLGGRLALVLPQSVLSSRDAAAVRAAIDARATMIWSWWTGERVFDAQVHTCVVGLEFGASESGDRNGRRSGSWSEVVTRRQGIPPLPSTVEADGTLGDRAQLNANFRDEYYGMIPAVGDHAQGPPLMTSGLIDPAVSWWGRRPITFAKQRFDAPRVALDRLDGRMAKWARRRLVPKVLVANQTKIIEAVCDPTGAWLPGVPVVAVYPRGVHWDDPSPTDRPPTREVATAAWEIAAVLTSPFASAWLWHRGAGSGLSADTVRSSPVVLADLPWPAGNLEGAVEAVRAGDVRACGHRIDQAYGIDDDELTPWWSTLLDGIEARRPPGVAP